MRSLTILSPAKVNLYLKVLGRRRDGYHELLTLFHRISLQDQLTLKKADRPRFQLITDHPKLKRVRDNLIYRAYQSLSRAARWKGGVRVKLKKSIPIASGLGGGSSNAAHFLLGMNQLFKLGLSRKKLVKLGAQLGSDVPFFLCDVNQAIGSGRGEKIKPLPAKNRFWFVLVVSHYGISTRLVYKRFKVPALTRISRDATITSAFLRRLKEGRLDRILRNDLFQASLAVRPELKDLDAFFEQLGVRQRLMSGSGPAMFSIHKSKHEAERIARLIKRRRRDVKVFVCHTY